MWEITILAVAVPGFGLDQLLPLDPWGAIEQGVGGIWWRVATHKLEVMGILAAIWLFGRVMTGDWR